MRKVTKLLQFDLFQKKYIIKSGIPAFFFSFAELYAKIYP